MSKPRSWKNKHLEFAKGEKFCLYRRLNFSFLQDNGPYLLKTYKILLYWNSESEDVQSCPTLCNPMDCSLNQASPSMGFSKQEYQRGFHFFPFPYWKRVFANVIKALDMR